MNLHAEQHRPARVGATINRFISILFANTDGKETRPQFIPVVFVGNNPVAYSGDPSSAHTWSKEGFVENSCEKELAIVRFGLVTEQASKKRLYVLKRSFLGGAGKALFSAATNPVQNRSSC
jgi:hypothetical protein